MVAVVVGVFFSKICSVIHLFIYLVYFGFVSIQISGGETKRGVGGARGATWQEDGRKAGF